MRTLLDFTFPILTIALSGGPPRPRFLIRARSHGGGCIIEGHGLRWSFESFRGRLRSLILECPNGSEFQSASDPPDWKARLISIKVNGTDYMPDDDDIPDPLYDMDITDQPTSSDLECFHAARTIRERIGGRAPGQGLNVEGLLTDICGSVCLVANPVKWRFHSFRGFLRTRRLECRNHTEFNVSSDPHAPDAKLTGLKMRGIEYMTNDVTDPVYEKRIASSFTDSDAKCSEALEAILASIDEEQPRHTHLHSERLLAIMCGVYEGLVDQHRLVPMPPEPILQYALPHSMVR
ncbi:hypothetical protein FOL47_001380 [Perkinsus chesapeaki]|uniref:Uncharacterized protein n=1 Tax=Perkinsus chesapeaki TaxID=330153 RepID=A0A7J6MJB4_PERCH|nr:hypothetical protein FOL47_001380 [Perkinsus chesapeaki]